MDEKPEVQHKVGKRKASWQAVVSLLAAMALFAAGCGGSPEADENAGDNAAGQRLKVVASFYPLYDFAAKIGGDHADVVNLVPAGVDSHDWSPKLQDMRQVSEADLFLYLGAGYEGWVDDFLAPLDTGDGPLAVETSLGVDFIRASGDDRVHRDIEDDESGHDEEGESGHDPGHVHEDEHDHEGAKENGADDGHDHEDAGENGLDAGHENSLHDHVHAHDTDPHVWLSPKQALVLAENIKNAFIGADPDHRADYETRFEQLKEKLDVLDGKLKKVADEASKKTFIVSHESFGYLARDYGLTQIGVMGLSPDAEPTVRKLEEIREQARQLGIRYILFEELVSPKVAETLAESLGIDTLVLNPLEGLTEEQLGAGDDYFTVMERNLETLAFALNGD